MDERRAARNIVAGIVILVLLAGLAFAFRFLVYPMMQGDLIAGTSSDSQYEHTVRIAADSFAGYAVLRSEAFRTGLGGRGIKVEIVDDAADYVARAKALRSQDVEMAVYTIDSDITSGAAIGSFPGTIVMVIDETAGADGIVAYQKSVPNVQALNHADAKIVATPSSPSETLARVTVTDFNLPHLGKDWLVEADGAADVYKQLRGADPADRRAYVLWEPYLSKALAIPGTVLLLDSGNVQGVIVDVLVAERRFLTDQPQVAQAVVEEYFRAQYAFEHQAGGMVPLLLDDAQLVGEPLTEAQAQKMVEGIRWKNTLENYVYFGLMSVQGVAAGQGLEDIIGNICRILVSSGGLDENPVEGRLHELYFDGPLRELQAQGFHPGQRLGVVDTGVPLPDEQWRGARELPALSEAKWEALMPVGSMRVPPIQFTRGGSKLSIQGDRDAAAVAQQLKAWPTYYITLIGHARAEGDAEANLALARDRAEGVRNRIIREGISPNRVRAIAAPAQGTGGQYQSVVFEFGQVGY